MIRDNQRVLNRIHVLLDALVIGGSYFLAWFIKFRLLSENEVGVGFLPAETYFRALYFIVPVYLGLYNWCGLYMSKRYSSSGREIFNLIKLGEKLNFRKESVISFHALIGAVLGYVFLDNSSSFVDETKDESNRNYHEMILRLVEPEPDLQKLGRK